MFRRHLIRMFETAGLRKNDVQIRSRLAASLPLTIFVHVLLIVAAVAESIWAVDFPDVAPKQTTAVYMLQSPEPPPPPPPPPPAASPSTPSTATPTMIVAPVIIPDEIPEVRPDPPSGARDPVEGGVPGGVEGGVAGGVIGGVLGGVIGSVLPSHEGPLRAEVDVAVPHFTSHAFPTYPEDAQKYGIQGTVVIDYVLDKEGHVKEVRVLQDPNRLLTAAAVSAIRKWRAAPTVINGQPVEVVHKISVIFTLE